VGRPIRLEWNGPAMSRAGTQARLLGFGSRFATGSSAPTGSRQDQGIGNGDSHHARRIPPCHQPRLNHSQPQGSQHNGSVSDAGGDRAAIFYTLIETAKLNGLDPEAYLAHAIGQLAAGHLATRLSELLPWNCKDALAAKAA
jgi:hypothetical protein